ncbi:MAG: outer membrane protein assembly factor BamE [Geminicoccaceae bacterium]
MTTRSVLVLGALLAATACSPTISNHGHRLDSDALAQIEPGISSREDVARLLGSPSAIGTFDLERWYYISQRMEQQAFYTDEITNQDVVAIDFDPTGVVASVDQTDMSAAKQIEPVDDKTKTMGNEFTLLEQLLGNVGRFNTDPSAIDGQVGRRPPGM